MDKRVHALQLILDTSPGASARLTAWIEAVASAASMAGGGGGQEKKIASSPANQTDAAKLARQRLGSAPVPEFEEGHHILSLHSVGRGDLFDEHQR